MSIVFLYSSVFLFLNNFLDDKVSPNVPKQSQIYKPRSLTQVSTTDTKCLKQQINVPFEALLMSHNSLNLCLISLKVLLMISWMRKNLVMDYKLMWTLKPHLLIL